MSDTFGSKETNRRGSPRRRPRAAVKVECHKGAMGLGLNLVATVLDISDSGVRLVLTQAFENLAEVELIISGYCVKENIKRLGNIRWQVKMENGQFCTGVEFQKYLNYRDWQNLSAAN